MALSPRLGEDEARMTYPRLVRGFLVLAASLRPMHQLRRAGKREKVHVDWRWRTRVEKGGDRQYWLYEE
jgi:hypothetical protein